ncbi:MAG: EF-P lysine aminoacylase EpmA [Kiritimatiellia bacterium]|jgi:lysyl-tRNA synthetase class 2|nr:EF-P lysine aminoacylase EpmA [Kiritimatiellia bacterium]MDP6847759.1 EF-P lysine aminoacylase EpmA [Kiritimatiellia bacterium]
MAQASTAVPSRAGILGARCQVLSAVRSFFLTNGFVEVETPVRIKCPALELNIDAEPSGSMYLRTSPELALKRVLAEGIDRVFELGPCFRKGERGAKHNPEYTMLEWYRRDADYLDILDDMRRLLPFVFEEVTGTTRFIYAGRERDVTGTWPVVSVRDAFREHAGWDPFVSFDADRFDLDLVDKVEPHLDCTTPVIMKDYPVALAALARRRPGDPDVAERWELYIAGMELANAFSELTNPAEQRERFETCAARRKAMGKEVYPIDEAFLRDLDGLPPSGGVALGIDRLVMLITGAESIDQVRTFV